MKIIKERMFPTVIYKVNNVLSKKNLGNIKEILINSHNENPINKWQSESTLHKLDDFKSLTNSVIELGEHAFDDLKYGYEKFEITEMWANISKQGDDHPVHTHLNNLFSGVFYVKSDGNANIRFLDPRPGANVLSPAIKEFNNENSNICSFPSIENTMLLFPAWLQHFVPINNSPHRRISISFNLMIRGLVGVQGNLQSAEF